MSTPNQLKSLGHLSVDKFLDQFWQQQAVYIPNGLADFKSPLCADDLFDLASDPDVESRIVKQDTDPPWQLTEGPFSSGELNDLGDSHWTLLVQGCNQYFEELAVLLDQFSFIPLWRIDDIMASFAPIHGSVGPHIDQYDVFLIQAMGTRRWEINSHIKDPQDLIENTDLSILQNFEAEQQWICKPGDILYLPPGVAHYGVALEECITLSVGFRAPSERDLWLGFMDHLIETAPDDEQSRFRDPQLKIQQHPGQIEQSALLKIRNILHTALTDTKNIDTWFGRYVTEPKTEALEQETDGDVEVSQFLQELKQNLVLWRSESSRFAYIDNAEQGCSLFIDGEQFSLSNAIDFAAAMLCDKRQFTEEDFSPHIDNVEFLELITLLFNQGKLHW